MNKEDFCMRCENCYFDEMCDNDNVCEDYTPVNEEVIDCEIDRLIECGRILFHLDWLEYIEEMNS